MQKWSLNECKETQFTLQMGDQAALCGPTMTVVTSLYTPMEADTNGVR